MQNNSAPCAGLLREYATRNTSNGPHFGAFIRAIRMDPLPRDVRILPAHADKPAILARVDDDAQGVHRPGFAAQGVHAIALPLYSPVPEENIMSITIKTAEEIEQMRVACRLAAEVLDYIEPHVKPGVTMLVLETALPAKFAETIVEATGRQPERPHWIKGLEGLEELPKRFVVVPNDTQTVKDYIVQHCND